MFFKLDVLKNFANLTGKHLRWSLFQLKMLLKNRLWPAILSKIDYNTGVFLLNLQRFKTTSFYREHLRWMLLCYVFIGIEQALWSSYVFFTKGKSQVFSCFTLSVEMKHQNDKDRWKHLKKNEEIYLTKNLKYLWQKIYSDSVRSKGYKISPGSSDNFNRFWKNLFYRLFH